MAKAPNKLIAPIVIAGVTLGFLTAAHRFIFSKALVKKAPVNKAPVDQAPVDKVPVDEARKTPLNKDLNEDQSS